MQKQTKTPHFSAANAARQQHELQACNAYGRSIAALKNDKAVPSVVRAY
jgi:hypothetical protein